MSHKISEACLVCGACINECPVEAINEGSEKYDINAEKCIDCGACVEVCPAEAISPE